MNKRLESALLTMGYDQDGKECGLKLASVLAHLSIFHQL
jgi:hypothetical protein